MDCGDLSTSAVGDLARIGRRVLGDSDRVLSKAEDVAEQTNA